MICSRQGMRLLSLCALVLGVMAIGAGGAQAEVGSHWNVNGKAINTELKPQVGSVLENNHGQFLSKALGASFSILCTGMTLESFVLKAEGGSLGRARFAGCKILLNKVVSAPCEPHTGAEKGVILTNLLKDLIVLHEGQPVDRIVAEEGVIVLIETGAECSIGSSINIIGQFVARDCKNEGTKELVVHLAEELAALTELFAISKTAEHKSTIDGSANVFLLPPHEGKLWSATPA